MRGDRLLSNCQTHIARNGRMIVLCMDASGGLFGEGDEHPSVENAFRYAVYRINHDRQLLPDTRLAYDIQHLPVLDGFRASKKVCLQVEQNTVAVFGPRSPELAGFVNSLCSSMQIPHIELRLDTDEPRASRALTVNLYPSSSELSRAFTDLIDYYGWAHLLVVYGSKDDLIKVQNVIRGQFSKKLDMVVRQVDPQNMRNVLKEAKAKKWTNILLDLDVDLTGLFLKMALQEGMIDPYHHFLLTNLDLESIDMEDFRHNYVNLTGFRLVDPEDKYTQAVMQDMEIYELQTDLQLLNATGFLSLPHEVALIYDAVYLLAHALEQYDQKTVLLPLNASCETPAFWNSGHKLYTYLNEMPLKGLTGDIQLNMGRRFNMKLDILQLKPQGLIKGGTWKYSSGINMSRALDSEGTPFGNQTLSITSVMPDLLPMLVVTTVMEPPFLMEPENPKSKEQFEGFIIDLLNELAVMVGFRYRIYLVPDGNYGSADENGEWNGMVRELIDRRADLAVAPLTINYVREHVIDFTKPFLNLGISIMFKMLRVGYSRVGELAMPRREKPGLFSFLSPLAVEIWLYVIGAYLLVSFTMFVLARFSPYEWYNPHPCNPDTDEVENTFDLANSFWFTVGTLMQQGSDVNPRALSTRLVGGTWWFFTLIIISSYTANLAAFLTIERMVSPIDDVDDLAKQTDIAFGTRQSGSTFTFFRDSTIDTYDRLYAYMKDHPEHMQPSVEAGIERVMEGGYAFFMENTMIEYQVQRNCDLMQVGGLLDSKGYGIGTPTNSAYRDKLSMAILEMQENGKIQLLYKKWWHDTGETCVREDDKGSTKANALGVDNVGGIFVVLMGGLGLAVLVAVCEFIWRSRRNAREDRTSLCSEMAQEMRFAVRCMGSSSSSSSSSGNNKKPRSRRPCSVCGSRDCEDPAHRAAEMPLTGGDPANGSIQLREVRRSPATASGAQSNRRFAESEFGGGAGPRARTYVASGSGSGAGACPVYLRDEFCEGEV